MSTADVINGTFEALGGCLLWMNVARIIKDKCCKGVSVVPTAFFMLWGYWNLYYYPHLSQWWSFVGGLNVVAANTTWVVLMLVYRKEHAT